MADGSAKAIEDVKVDDVVLGYDVSAKNYVTSTVLELESPLRQDYYTISFEDGSQLKVTDEHPIYIRSFFYEGWGSIIPKNTLEDSGIEAQAIKAGDEVFKEDGWVKITGIEHTVKEVQTYNLKKVSNTNTFFADGILVHNKGGCTPKTCADLGKECGVWGDGCGGNITCGNKTNGHCLTPGETCKSDGTCSSCLAKRYVCSANSDCCTNNCIGFIDNTRVPGMIAWEYKVENICCNSTSLPGPVTGNVTSTPTIGGKCYGKTNLNRTAVFLNVSGKDRYAAPRPRGWTDCDIDPYIAKGACRNVCDGGWVKWGQQLLNCTLTQEGEVNIGTCIKMTTTFGENCGTASNRKVVSPSPECSGDDDPFCKYMATAGNYACYNLSQSDYGCCGDDPGENIITGSRLFDPSTGPRCCPKSTDCVDKNGNCIPAGASTDGKVCGTCVPKTCAELGKECGVWDDGCGGNITCGNKTNGQCLTPGETCRSDGSCNSSCLKQRYICSANSSCCSSNCVGFMDNTNYPNMIAWEDEVAKICCNSTSISGPATEISTGSSSIGGKCYGKTNLNNTARFLNISGNDRYAAPRPRGWTDCDVSPYIANGACSNVCDGGWVKWGESVLLCSIPGAGDTDTCIKMSATFGENCGTAANSQDPNYPDKLCTDDPDPYCALTPPKGSTYKCVVAGQENYGCCGDDPDEFLISGGKVLGTTGPRCCSNSTDCVDAEGNCVPTGMVINGKKCGGCGWLQPNLDGTKSGCCPKQNMCLVDPNGDPNLNMTDWYKVNWEVENNPALGPRCIYAGEFLLDDRCESGGNWSTRTKYLSMAMYSKTQGSATVSDDFTLFCDDYENSLNYYKQVFEKYQMDTSFLKKGGVCGVYPCLGSYFCVLLEKETSKIKAVGGTINPDSKGDLSNFTLLYKVLNLSGAHCTASSSNEFADCGKGLSYDGAIGAFIYTRTINNAEIGNAGLFESIFLRLRSMFDSLFGNYRAIMVKDVKATADLYNFNTPDMNRLYVSRQGAKTIFAIEESTGNIDRLMINYTGFSTNICDEMDAVIKAGMGNCTKTGTSYYISANRTGKRTNAIFDRWQEMTSSLRVK